ncbi:MAG: hypothetical protein AAGU11_21815 [Syntrophobacteraceae bacterium]
MKADANGKMPWTALLLVACLYFGFSLTSVLLRPETVQLRTVGVIVWIIIIMAGILLIRRYYRIKGSLFQTDSEKIFTAAIGFGLLAGTFLGCSMKGEWLDLGMVVYFS